MIKHFHIVLTIIRPVIRIVYEDYMLRYLCHTLLLFDDSDTVFHGNNDCEG